MSVGNHTSDTPFNQNGGNRLSILTAIHDENNTSLPFVHALRLAIDTRGELEVADVRSEPQRDDKISVRSTLEKWGMLPEGSKRSDVATLGIRVKKVVKEGNKRRLLKKRLMRHNHDLLVIGTGSADGSGSIFKKTLAEYMADFFGQMTLFIPVGVRPFVDEASGVVDLRRVVVPVENDLFYRAAMVALCRIHHIVSSQPIEVVGLHAGTAFPDIDRMEDPLVTWREEVTDSPVVDAVCSAADSLRADLVVMATNGRDTFSQKIIGSNTEQVLRQVSCPVLSVSVI